MISHSFESLTIKQITIFPLMSVLLNFRNQIQSNLLTISFCSLNFLLRPISVHLFILTAKRQLNNGTGQKPITSAFQGDR